MENKNKKNRGGVITSLLIKLLIFVIFIFLLLWLFPTKESLNPLYQDVFRNNINSMKDAAETYFTNERLPKNVGDKVKITLKEMLEKDLLLPFVDRYGKECDADKSYVEITKTETEYEMEVHLICSQEESSIIEHMGCTDKCNTCKDSVDKIVKEYQYQRDVEKKVVSSYKCASGYTLKGNKCYKDEKATSKIDATPIYDSDGETIPATPVYEDKTETINATAKYEDKTETINATAHTTKKEDTYSEWSDWSANKEYDPDNNNIAWGQQELVWNEKNGAKKKTITKYVTDYDSPIYQITYDNLVGSYKQYVCSGYNYYRDSITSTTYQYSDWSLKETKTYSYVPENTNTTKYIVTGMDFTSCSDTCSLKPYYIVKVYTRSIKAVTQTKDELSATCNVTEKSIPVYGKKKTFVGYVQNKVTETVYTYLYHTKTRTKIEGETITTYTCPTGYKLDGTKCTKQVKVISEYTCPTGYKLAGTKCNKTSKIISGYTCPTGYKLTGDGKQCSNKTTDVIIGYSCPASYTKRIGKYCYKDYTKTVSKAATPVYKTVNTIEYKWSTESSLKGWKATGKTRTNTIKVDKNNKNNTCTCTCSCK